MLATLSLVRREFSAYFFSPIAYVVLAVFLAVTGHLFYLSLMQLTAHGPKGISYPMQLIVNDVAFWRKNAPPARWKCCSPPRCAMGRSSSANSSPATPSTC